VEPLSLSGIALATGGTLHGDPRVRVLRVTTDSRDVRPGDLFTCLVGPRFDGHGFARAALSAGAVAVLASRRLPDDELCGGAQLVVTDTLAALGLLGRHVREGQSSGRRPLVLGITGTNGKTTTKDLLAAALGSRWPVVASRRSFNNDIGVPLTLLDIGADTRAAVVEMGTNAPGEIAALAALARPDVGIITNIGAGHLAGLHSIEGVRAEKGALLEGLTGRRVSILNRDDPSFAALAARAPGPVVSFGLSPEADVRATDVRCDGHGTRFTVGGRTPVALQLLGRHAVLNALAAIAGACVAGVDLDAAVAALAAVPSPPGRLQVRRVRGLLLIDDTYNANPGSFAAAVATLAELKLGGRLVVVAGDMLELGAASPELHRVAGARLAALAPALVVTVGEHGPELLAGAREAGLPDAATLACRGTAQASAQLSALLRDGDVVLLKGSRGIHLDSIVADLARPQASVA
jgi:UDP-N-acetylmuramoyl-tripeptide--D-alanyl-D-alanine ligase